MTTIDQILEQRKLSVGELASMSGIAAERVEAIVAGRWMSSPDERQAIARALGLPVEEISWGHTMSPRVVRYHRFGLKEDFKRGPDADA